MTMLDRQPKRESMEQAYFGWGSIDEVNLQHVGNRTLKTCARRGSKVAREAHATTPHPSNPRKLICWFFLGILTLIACPGSLALVLLGIRGAA